MINDRDKASLIDPTCKPIVAIAFPGYKDYRFAGVHVRNDTCSRDLAPPFGRPVSMDEPQECSDRATLRSSDVAAPSFPDAIRINLQRRADILSYKPPHVRSSDRIDNGNNETAINIKAMNAHDMVL